MTAAARTDSTFLAAAETAQRNLRSAIDRCEDAVNDAESVIDRFKSSISKQHADVAVAALKDRVNTWLNRQILVGIHPEGRRAVEQLLEDLQ